MPLMEKQIERTLSFQSMISEYPKEMDRYFPEIVITRDDCNDVVNFLNTQVAGSVYNLISPEITAIITEEISYYVGGVGTAEECAKKSSHARQYGSPKMSKQHPHRIAAILIIVRFSV